MHAHQLRSRFKWWGPHYIGFCLKLVDISSRLYLGTDTFSLDVPENSSVDKVPSTDHEVPPLIHILCSFWERQGSNNLWLFQRTGSLSLARLLGCFLCVLQLLSRQRCWSHSISIDRLKANGLGFYTLIAKLGQWDLKPKYNGVPCL